jgi:teichuronic acid biosynthesis glycosyltransferase TuaC
MRILAVTNIYPTEKTPTSGTFVQQQIEGLRRIGVEVNIMLVERAQKGMRAYVGLRKQVAEKLERFQPDLVHAMYGGVMAHQVVRAAGKTPSVVTFHGSDLLGERLSGALRRIVSTYGIRESWAAARLAHGVVIVSSTLRDALPDDVDRAKVAVIPCGIDLDVFKPLDSAKCRKTLGWHPDRFHILFPANSGDPVKRPELAKSAVDILTEGGLPAEMHQLRGVCPEDVPVWLNASDCLLLTSLHEGSPTVVKEALACNIPVVSVDVGDVHERLREIAGCYLALPEPKDLSTKLRMVYTAGKRILGREKMYDLSLECVARRLEDFYRTNIGLRDACS